MANDFLDDPAFGEIIRSKEYVSAKAAKRGKFLEAVKGMTPEERAELAGQLTPVEPMNPRQAVGTALQALPGILKQNAITGGKQGAAMSIDMGGQVGGAALGGAINPALMPIGEMAGAVGADRLNRAIGLRDPNTVDLPFAGQIENRHLLGPITTGDVAAAAPPGIVRGLSGALKLTTKPAQQAIQAADEANVANTTAYDQKVQRTTREYQQAIGKAKRGAEAKNAERAEKYKEVVDKETNKFRDAVAKVNQDTSLTNQQQMQKYQDLHRDYKEAVKAHRLAAQAIPNNATAGVDVGDYRAAYNASDAAVGRAGTVDLAPLRAEAQALNIDLTAPMDPLGRTPMSRITAALSEAGLTKPQAVDPMDAAFGSVPQAGQAVQVPLDRLIATHGSLGKIVGSLEGRGGSEWGAAKKLYAKTEEMLNRAKTANPDAADAIDQYIEGRRAFRRQESMNDFEELFQPGHNGNSLTRQGDIELSGKGIQTAFAKLRKEDQFFSGSFTKDELDQMQGALKDLPRRIPKEPPANAPTPLQPDYTRLKQPETIPYPKKIEPNYSKIKPKWPGERPATAEPDVGKFPFGQFILSKILVQEGAATATGQQGSLPRAGLVFALSGFGVPHWVSQALVNSPRGTAMVRNILEKKQALTPEILATLTTAARAMGGQPQED